MDLLDIPRQHISQFKPPRAGGKPRIVVGNVSDWRAIHVWSPDYLRSVAGSKMVSVREANGPPRNIYQNLSQGGGISFSEYLDWVLEIAREDDVFRAARTCRTASEVAQAVSKINFESSYYLDVKLASLSKELLEDIRVPQWYDADPVDILLWCGVFGTSSGLHFDITPNCNVQIAGQKHFILFHPSEAGRLYKVRSGSHCRFDPTLPDFDRFPLARQARGWKCTLSPGESLYIPAGWFHQVTVATPWALNVNFFWPRIFPQGLITPTLWPLVMARMWVKFRVGMRRRVRVATSSESKNVS